MPATSTEMLILDTDHWSELDRRSPSGLALRSRLSLVDDRVGTTIVSIEEQLRGLLGLIKSAREPVGSVRCYTRLQRFLADVAIWDVLPFDEPAAREFGELKELRLRIGTMDSKIAAMALVTDATLLSRNARDFSRVAGLRLESWLE